MYSVCNTIRTHVKCGCAVAKQTITVRLDEEDLSYLAGLDVAGATNLSEKIRALLGDARRQREGLADAGAASPSMV